MCTFKSKWGLFVVVAFLVTIMVFFVFALNATFIDTEQLRSYFNIYYINKQIDVISEKHFALVTFIFMLVYVAYA
jgi:hypothetical protein